MLLITQPPNRGTVQCWACGQLFYAGHSSARYCSSPCRQWAYRRRRRGGPWGFKPARVTPPAPAAAAEPAVSD